MTHTVGILGNVNIDLLMGPLPRLPQFGRELLVPRTETRASGAAGYTAIALDRLGLRSLCVGAIGDDMWGDFIRHDLARYHLAALSSLETIADTPTGMSVALLDSRGERGFVSCAGALAHVDADLLARHEERLLASRYVVVCGYFFMPSLRGEPMRAFLRRARQAGVVVMFDTGWDIDDWPPATCQEVLSLLPVVDIFLPNAEEARVLTGADSPVQMAERLLQHGARAVALKLGPDGSLWADHMQLVQQPGRPVKAVDATGAGDCFNAALIYGLEQAWPPRRTLAFANTFCSVVVSRLQDRYPSVDETIHLMEDSAT